MKNGKNISISSKFSNIPFCVWQALQPVGAA